MWVPGCENKHNAPTLELTCSRGHPSLRLPSRTNPSQQNLFQQYPPPLSCCGQERSLSLSLSLHSSPSCRSLVTCHSCALVLPTHPTLHVLVIAVFCTKLAHSQDVWIARAIFTGIVNKHNFAIVSKSEFNRTTKQEKVLGELAASVLVPIRFPGI